MPTNMDAFFPFDAGTGANITEDQWRKMARLWLDSGVVRGEDLDLQAYGDSTGMQVKVRTGKVWIRGHYGENTATKTLAVAAAHATLARIDRVIARADFTNNRVELDVLTGVAAASPVAPALTQSTAVWEIPIGLVSVPAADTSIDAGQVTDARVWTGPALAAATWIPYTPVWSGTIGNGTLTGRYIQLGKTVHYYIELTWGTTTTHAAAGQSLTIPVATTFGPFAPMGHAGIGDAGVSLHHRFAKRDTTTSIIFHDLANVAVSNTVPMTWGNLDSLMASGTYESV